MIDRRPAAIVRAASADDVAPVIRFARETGLPLAIRGGGHNVAGNGTVEGGIVLDLGGLTRRSRSTPTLGSSASQAGATLGDIDRATEPFGLAVPIGVVSGTGIAGLTLGGGVGWLTRALRPDDRQPRRGRGRHGDRRARPRERDRERRPVLGRCAVAAATSGSSPRSRSGPGHWTRTSSPARSSTSGRTGPRRLQAYAAWTADLPDAMTSIITFTGPAAGLGARRPGPDVHRVRLGGRRSSRRARRRPTDCGMRRPRTWPSSTRHAGSRGSRLRRDGPKGVRAYWKNASFDRLDDAMIATIVEHCGRADVVRDRGRPPPHGWCLRAGRRGRDALPEPLGPVLAEHLRLLAASRRRRRADGLGSRVLGGDAIRTRSAGQYVNFLGHDDGTDARRRRSPAYGPAKLDRLVALKRRFDPDNMFRINHNIPTGLSRDSDRLSQSSR